MADWGGNPKPLVQPGDWHHMPGVLIECFCRRTSYQLEHHWRGEKRQDAREVTVGWCNLVCGQMLMVQDLMDRRLASHPVENVPQRSRQPMRGWGLDTPRDVSFYGRVHVASFH